MSITFNPPYIEGVIQSRKSQFTIIVAVEGDILSCHCPTTGRVGNLDLNGRPCLLSKAADPNRKTLYTVEAVSLNRPEDLQKTWIGINQNAANRYVEHYLVNGAFSEMVGTDNTVHREQFLGVSKLDFLVGSTYLEVKTPLQHLQVDYPDYVKTKKTTPFSTTDRFVKHITELANSLENHQRAILLICFIYDNPGFQVIERSTNYGQIKNAVEVCVEKGIEFWQSNFFITESGVTLSKYFQLSF
jgi:sugar fermentation stimulation protein A